MSSEGIWGMAPFSFFGFSATMASVVINRPSHRSRVLKRKSGHLGRIDDPGLHEVFILARFRVEAEAPFPFHDPLNDHRSLKAGIVRDLLHRALPRPS